MTGELLADGCRVEPGRGLVMLSSVKPASGGRAVPMAEVWAACDCLAESFEGASTLQAHEVVKTRDLL